VPEKKAAKPKTSESKSSKPRPPEQTFEEVKYLKRLIDDQIPVAVKMSDNQIVRGTVEYYDVSFIRVTREDGPNLFIFKHDIKYIYEIA
jgi:sRNA-binding regulator protein Hfq